MTVEKARRDYLRWANCVAQLARTHLLSWHWAFLTPLRACEPCGVACLTAESASIALNLAHAEAHRVEGGPQPAWLGGVG